jgi:hypothetical protein
MDVVSVYFQHWLIPELEAYRQKQRHDEWSNRHRMIQSCVKKLDRALQIREILHAVENGDRRGFCSMSRLCLQMDDEPFGLTCPRCDRSLLTIKNNCSDGDGLFICTHSIRCKKCVYYRDLGTIMTITAIKPNYDKQKRKPQYKTHSTSSKPKLQKIRWARR